MSQILPEIDISELESIPSVEYARKLLRERDEETLSELLELVQVPAPSLDEGQRAELFRERLEESGLEHPYIDDVGNVIALLPTENPPGIAPGEVGDGSPPIVVAAHLDTVFSAETDLVPRREGDRYLAPGIGDNTRGLVALLALARAIVSAEIVTALPIVFIGTVGEEGIGDLYGVKHLFRDGSPWRRAAAFIAVDGTGLRRIVNQAIGSRRLRVRVTGPGGHSWADWGRANPISAASRAIAALSDLEVPERPRTTLTVGRIGGGTSVNTIPEEAWFELDLRSEDGATLAALEASVRGAIEAAVQESNQARAPGSGSLDVVLEVIGDRPAGKTASDSPLVSAASAATRAIGETPELVASSTDANVPISLGIPSITLGAGGRSGGAHTLGEWYENEGGSTGLERLLLTLLGIAGVT